MNEEEIKKGIELLKKAVDDNHKISEHYYYFDDYQMSKLQQETFKLADALNQEKEKNKKLEEEKKQAFKDYMSTSAELYRVINMIAEDYYQDYISGERSDLPCEYLDGIKKRKEYPKCEFKDCMCCMKEYYFSKARGE